MADRRQIESMARRKEAEIQGLEAQLREARVYLQALQDVLRRFPKAEGADSQTEAALRPGSMTANAKDAIEKAGRPLHVDEILLATGRELTRGNRTALGGSLSAYVRKRAIFSRSAPNTFGLIGMEHVDRQDHEPPADFGFDPPKPDDDDVPF